MTDVSNTGQAYTVSEIAAESPTWRRWNSVTVLPTVLLVPESDSAGIFKEDSLVSGETPGIFFSQLGHSIVKLSAI